MGFLILTPIQTHHKIVISTEVERPPHFAFAFAPRISVGFQPYE